MLNNLNSVPSATAPDVLFDFLVGLEAPERTLYKDIAGKATIGVGFNLTIPDVLNVVLEMGFGFNLGSPTDLGVRNSLLAIFQNTSLSASAMQAQANAVMAGRQQGSSFTFASGAAGLIQMRNIFNSKGVSVGLLF